MKKLNIVGGGLAGTEAAWQAANRGIQVNLYEMRSLTRKTQAHHTDKLAELVCSNSFRNDDSTSAIGLLHAEMRKLNSLIMMAADKTKVPAGSALAMDRDQFADIITHEITNHRNISVIRQEVEEIPTEGKWIFATGPLTSEKLSQSIMNVTGEDKLAFFDAIAPIVYKDSINFDIAWFQSRYDKEGPSGNGKDYINCPLDKEQYYAFIDKLLAGEKTEFKEWEKDTPYFNGCLPIEVMAERGRDTLRFGPMKPVGLTNPNSDKKPYAVLQLRQDNALGSLYNIVGFQTKLKYNQQKEIFSSIPGLEAAEFARLGGLHRNTFINSPKLLGSKLELKMQNNISFAGQITGVEGYVESAAMGLLAGLFASYELNEQVISTPPVNTAMGGLLSHLTHGADSSTFQPMNINFGLLPGSDIKISSKKDRNTYISQRALSSLDKWIQYENIIK
ncbi:MAG: methylenetetrahydrofolate--tRNA-(uracil(54)-C(5))-methyltransferase (FADH(2)-oxidizing) TrmFO [Rickettsiales bacterium]|nr:MAG: methylenetetrahydrofolate--tRNA-(uracil(54)-C(5))-methyltransferase (FADH(2)-oxidizing) TrmFO [Rickettsiales bacterium]